MQPQANIYPDRTLENVRNRACKIHGNLIKQVELRITAGAIEPTVGEILTGATSGDTGVVTSVRLESGAWNSSSTGHITDEERQPLKCENSVLLITEHTTLATGTAVATVYLNGHAGVDANTLEWGSGTESITGSIGGAGMMTRYYAHEISSGWIFPEQSMVFHESAWYCIDCYRRIFPKKYLDEWQVTDDDDYLRSDNYGR
jgi:hypothetical protein